jgi:hypothetical protein
MVDVELSDHHFALIITADFFDYRTDHAARSAPFCPEVQDHGFIGVQDHVLEVRIGDF